MTEEPAQEIDPGETASAEIRVRLVFGGETAFGPGKADLLEGIRETGSIAASGRRMGMSYKRAWTLVETLNDSFAEPLVISTRGGQSGGGAQLTKTGERVLELYRRIESSSRKANRENIAALSGLQARPRES